MKIKLQLVELHQKSSDPNYLIGCILNESSEWVTFLSIDPAGNQGGIRFLKTSDITEINENSPALNFVKSLLETNQLNDPFTLTGNNRSIVTSNLQSLYEILQYALKNEKLLKMNLRNVATYGGYITELSNDEVRLFSYNDDKVFENLVETTIKLKDIVEIIFNDADLKLSSEYFSYLGSEGEIGNELGLSQIYFRYTDDFRFGNDMMLGWIVAESDHYLLVERIDDVGQIMGVSLVGKKAIAHITNDSDYLNFINFACEYNQKHGNLDPHHFDELAHQFTQIPTFAEIITTSKPDHLLLVDDYQFDGINWGTVISANEQGFILRPIANFDFSDPVQIPYSDLASIDLISSDTIHLQTYLKWAHRI